MFIKVVNKQSNIRRIIILTIFLTETRTVVWEMKSLQFQPRKSFHSYPLHKNLIYVILVWGDNQHLNVHKRCSYQEHFKLVLGMSVSFSKGKFLYLKFSPSACLVTTWLSVDTIHSVVFLLCKYRRGELSTFSWDLKLEFHFRLKCQKIFNYSIILLSTSKRLR